jgi:prevent-host-death family protein
MGAPDERDPTLPRLLVRKGIAVKEWKMEQARARLSELIKAARQQGPQYIKLRGKPVAVVLSKEDFDRLGGGASESAGVHCRFAVGGSGG